MALATTLKNLFNLEDGEENKKITLESARENIYFNGANLWILICAIFIACIGLNINSIPVIIGAMLISPLMGPILGAGFALGIYDFQLLRKSLGNLLIATVMGLLVSALYFYITPFKEVQSEILARTTPTIYDVVIAFFGGIAGTIAITRREKGNSIPGVAIATALMPPLCTAGFGIATGNSSFFFGAIYLYLINCVFICIATFTIVKYLRYPRKKQLNEQIERKVKYGIGAITIMMIIPSILFAVNLLKEQEFRQRANNFINQEFIAKGNTVIYKNLSYTPTNQTIELAFLKDTFKSSDIDNLNKKLVTYSIPNAKLIIKESNSVDIKDLKNDILSEISSSQQKIQNLENQVNVTKIDNNQLFSEAKILFPSLREFSVSEQDIATKSGTDHSGIIYYSTGTPLSQEEKTKLEKWIQQRLGLESTILVVRDNSFITEFGSDK